MEVVHRHCTQQSTARGRFRTTQKKIHRLRDKCYDKYMSNYCAHDEPSLSHQTPEPTSWDTYMPRVCMHYGADNSANQYLSWKTKQIVLGDLLIRGFQDAPETNCYRPQTMIQSILYGRGSLGPLGFGKKGAERVLTCPLHSSN